MKDAIKQCRCIGSTSELRMYPKVFGKDTLVPGFAAMVCDLCETPWEEITKDNVASRSASSVNISRNAKRS